ncbi:hypothetical protein C8F01DRAFT_1127289 [Mycena amicta]|nr:hypothetical protein C8F01DRAFT_1127289 [Mycena amicta]
MAAPAHRPPHNPEGLNDSLDDVDGLRKRTEDGAQSGISDDRYHLEFRPPLASDEEPETITLVSSQGTLYCVARYTLQKTSGFFAMMFTLPAPAQSLDTESAARLEVYESDLLLEPLLQLVCGLETPAWDIMEISTISALLFLAERWSMSGPIATLRKALTAPIFLKTSPLCVYALAAHFGWKDVIQLASTHTLSIDLLWPPPEEATVLSTVSTSALLALLCLHRTRLTTFRTLINSPERFLAGNSVPFYCSACARTPLDNTSWRTMRTRLVKALEEDLSGETLLIDCAVGGMHAWPETQACWDAKCIREGCGAKNYDKPGTIRQIQRCLEGLPSCVEVDWVVEDVA